MEIIKGYRFRIYPNKQQRILIEKNFGCCRFIYNHFLEVRTDAYKNNGERISFFQSSGMLTALKKELTWLKEADSIALTESLRDLDNAFQNFFDKRSFYPKFHTKHSRNQSYRTRNQKNGKMDGIRVSEKHVFLPKLRNVRCKISMPVNGRILNATIRKVPSGKYYVSLCVRIEAEYKRVEDNKVGLHLGISDFCSESSGCVVCMPEYLKNSQKRLAMLQRSLSKKVHGSSNYEKQRLKVAKAFEKITNQKNDFLHKYSTKLVKENQIISIEDIDVSQKVRQKHFAKYIHSVSWGTFRGMLEYKSEWYGTQLVVVPRLFKSVQICSNCGVVNPKVKKSSVRNWTCHDCGAEHHRGINAGKNVLAKGLTLI